MSAAAAPPTKRPRTTTAQLARDEAVRKQIKQREATGTGSSSAVPVYNGPRKAGAAAKPATEKSTRIKTVQLSPVRNNKYSLRQKTPPPVRFRPGAAAAAASRATTATTVSSMASRIRAAMQPPPSQQQQQQSAEQMGLIQSMAEQLSHISELIQSKFGKEAESELAAAIASAGALSSAAAPQNTEALEAAEAANKRCLF